MIDAEEKQLHAEAEGKRVFTSSVVAPNNSVCVYWSDDKGVTPKDLHAILNAVAYNIQDLQERYNVLLEYSNGQNERIVALEAQVAQLLTQSQKTFGGQPV